MVSLNELLTQGPVAVTFHRGHWCPYCRININALAQAHEEIAAQGGQIVAIMRSTAAAKSGLLWRPASAKARSCSATDASRSRTRLNAASKSCWAILGIIRAL
jgi:hypothetical protein